MNRPRFLVGALAFLACTVQAGEPLRSFNADLSQTTVSGLSAGAFFATQIHVAHSQHIKGMGSIAGGPYFCAEGSLNKAYNAKQGDAGSGIYTGQCMGGNFGGVDAAQMAINEARQEANAGRIDALSNLTNAKVFIYGGTLDPTVVPNVVAQNKPFYTRLGVPDSSIRVETTIRDGHAMPLMDRQSIANACGATNAQYGYGSVSPWMSNCGYDAAGLMLQHFYGALNARVPLANLRGRFVQFDQTEFTRAAGARYMNTEGFMYVPPSCDSGERCRVHVAFHGCHQVWDKPAGDSGANMGDRFYRYAGYNEWAENNRIIVLYPQAQKTTGVDPRGCFDWWGFEESGSQNGPCNNVAKTTYGQCSAASYHTKEGAQIKAVWAMVERVAQTPRGDNPPVVNSANATSGQGCSTVTANVTDPDNDLADVWVRIDSGTAVKATPSGNGNWTYQACIGKGPHTAGITGVDQRNHSSAERVASFTITDLPVDPPPPPGNGIWQPTKTSTFGLANVQVFWPKNPNPAVIDGKRALMLSLHGCMQSSTDVIDRHFNWEAVSERTGMVIVAPTTPSSGRVVSYPSNCWNWFGTSHSRQADDVAKLLQLVDALKRDPDLWIDPNQVYVSGLSAGSGESHVLSCIAPDVFAGFGVVATPALGSASGDAFTAPKRTPAQVAATCKSLAGSEVSRLDTQIASFLYGSSDGLVPPQHNVVNADGMKLVYATGSSATSFSITGGGSGSSWVDARGKPRVSLVSVSGMDHSWPAGSTGTQNTNYVNNRFMSYPEYLTNYLFSNNLRVRTRQVGDPVLRCNPIAVSGNSATVDCAATDDGTIASYRIARSGPSSLTETTGSGVTLLRQYPNLPLGRYTFDVTATDNTGRVSNVVSLQADVGPQPPQTESLTATVVEHYSAKRITLQQYLAMGSRLGYNTRVTLYRCGTGWSESSTCA